MNTFSRPHYRSEHSSGPLTGSTPVLGTVVGYALDPKEAVRMVGGPGGAEG